MPAQRFQLGGLSVVVFLLVAAVCAAPFRSAAAQEAKQDHVPLKKVILFNSGVGYFEHAGAVDGNATVDLKFNVDDVNDLLKSMVLQDLGGGQISTVTYGSRDPITKTLKTFAIDLTKNPSLSQLLEQIRGEPIEIEAPNKIVGTIIGVEHRRRKVGQDEIVEYHLLTLLTESGLRSVSLENVSRIKLLNAKLDAELRQALKILALGNATDKKTVSLNFVGRGERQVRIGYVQETPIWKTSYRLVLKDDEAPFLQGWAIVENTTEADWSNVELTLVSGRPISFRMDLYQPLYVERPLIVPELYSSLVPKTYGQDLVLEDVETAAIPFSGRLTEALREKRKKRSSVPLTVGPGRARAFGDKWSPDLDVAFRSGSFDITESVKSLAQAADVGELFQYQIEMPVTLARQRSAMLPIVNQAVKGKKVSIYNPQTHAKHPLNGLRLTNTTDLHLMQGPITVFDGGTYAGDARIQDLPPKSSRLISYALDLDTEVASAAKSSPEQLTSVKIVKGTLYSSRKYRRSRTYTVKNSGKRTKDVLIEQPFDANWKLVAPKKPAEKTRALYRFAVAAEPGEPAKLVVDEERNVSQSIVLTNIPDSVIRIYLSARIVSEQVKAALREVIRQKQSLSQLAASRRRLEQRIQAISKEQGRIRKNMSAIGRNSDLYNRYVKKFTRQEDEIERLQTGIEKLKTDEAKQKKRLDEFLIGLDVT